MAIPVALCIAVFDDDRSLRGKYWWRNEGQSFSSVRQISTERIEFLSVPEECKKDQDGWKNSR